MVEQLPLDFSASSAERQRRARKRLEKAQAETARPSLFDAPPNLDIHLHSPTEAIASASGDPERSFLWLSAVVGPLTALSRRRVVFPVQRLDRLAWVRPPVQVTLDAAATAYARAVWAHSLGLRPLQISKKGKRLVALSPPRWPAGLALRDVPWSAILALVRSGVPLDVADTAAALLSEKLASAGVPLATAGLAGSAVSIRTTRPDLIEKLGLPGLAYDGEKGSGAYRMPLLASEPLLGLPQVALTAELESAIRRAHTNVRPVASLAGFPWTLYPFQARDVARALRVVETTGGVLLAAEMGSGKTTMALAIVHQLQLDPLLVVAPLSAFSTWSRQLEEMGKNFYLATESSRKVWDRIAEGSDDVVVISYDRLAAFAEIIERRHFRGVIADEIQRIRTPGSRRSRALRQLAAAIPVRIGLSGTPLTNTVNDLLPVGAFLAPGEWRPRANSKDLSDMYPGDPVEAVAEHLGSMMVRRRMTEVGAKLPKRNDHRVFVDLTQEQRRALAELEAEAEAAREEGLFDDNQGRMHAFARLQRMRQIINAPEAAGVAGPNPKLRAALELVASFVAVGRKGVLFCADRSTFKRLGEALTESGIGWVGIWGATPPQDRIRNERRFHTDPDVKVVLCTIQAGSESWSASPTATWLVSTSYMYAPSMLAQMEARVFRMNSDPDGPDIEICYLHASGGGGTLDDRMVEILEHKKRLFAQVVDRTAHTDDTEVHYSMNDLLFLLTGEHSEQRALAESDSKRVIAEEKRRKRHAAATLHRRKTTTRSDAALADDGETAVTLEQHRMEESEATGSFVSVDELISQLDSER